MTLISMKPSRIFNFIMIWTLLSIIACKVTRNTDPVVPPAGFDWEGHRGCRGLMPENTVPAFLKALEFPEVTTLELDLAVSKDGQMVISHEPWFNPEICRQPTGDSIARRDAEKFLIYGFTYGQIRGFDCGSWGNPRFPEQQKMKVWKPTLREAVEAVRKKYPEKSKTVQWNVEIKSQPEWDGIRHPPVAEFAQMTVDEIKALTLENNVIVQSFDVRALKQVHKIAPNLKTALLIENIRSFKSNLKALGYTPTIYSPYHLLVTPKLVRKCHAAGIKLVPWTVDDVPTMRSLIHLGVDGIITDYPNMIKEVGKGAPVK
jgi:glycerophosphoryl diester phosphodiesterase